MNNDATTNANVDDVDDKLPPDPDGLNDDRAGWAQMAVEAFQEATGSDDETAVVDLLADLMHYCDRNGLDFDTELDSARGHYEAETEALDEEDEAAA